MGAGLEIVLSGQHGCVALIQIVWHEKGALSSAPTSSSTVTKDGNDVSLGVFSFVYVLLPQSGIFQIVKDRFLAGTALLLALHPDNSVFHSKIQGRRQV